MQAKYHATCYATYTNKSNLERVSGSIGCKNITASIKKDDDVTIAFNLLLEGFC